MFSDRTAIRTRSAVLSLIFSKVIRLKSLQDKSAGEVCPYEQQGAAV